MELNFAGIGSLVFLLLSDLSIVLPFLAIHIPSTDDQRSSSTLVDEEGNQVSPVLGLAHSNIQVLTSDLALLNKSDVRAVLKQFFDFICENVVLGNQFLFNLGGNYDVDDAHAVNNFICARLNKRRAICCRIVVKPI